MAETPSALTPEPRRPFLHGLLLGWSLAQAVTGVLLLILSIAVGNPWLTVLGMASLVVGTLIHIEERKDPA